MALRTVRLSRVAAVVCALSLLAAAACGRTAATWADGDGVASSSPSATSATWQLPPSSSPAGPTSPPTISPTPSPTKPPTLDDYLAKIPTFGPAPAPVAVTLAHAEGRAAWQFEIPTTNKVAFITIDDGLTRHPWARDLIRAANVPVTLFLTTNYISGHIDYFRQLRDAGAVVIEGHTVSHPKLRELTYDEQRQQLCHSSDLIEQWYGRRPVFFRAPYGEKNDDTLRAAWDCGLRVGLHWRETVDKGVVRYQRTDKRVRPGDIILMHFRPAFPDDFLAALIAIKAAGLCPALLEDYVEVPPSTPA